MCSEPSKGRLVVIGHRQPPVPRCRPQRLDVHADQEREYGKRLRIAMRCERTRSCEHLRRCRPPPGILRRHLKTGHFLTPVDRDVDGDEGLVFLDRHEKRLGYEQTAASRGAGPTRMDPATHWRETGIRRETASDYLKAAGFPVRSRAGARSAASRCQNSGDGVRFRVSHW